MVLTEARCQERMREPSQRRLKEEIWTGHRLRPSLRSESPPSAWDPIALAGGRRQSRVRAESMTTVSLESLDIQLGRQTPKKRLDFLIIWHIGLTVIAVWILFDNKSSWPYFVAQNSSCSPRGNKEKEKGVSKVATMLLSGNNPTE